MPTAATTSPAERFKHMPATLDVSCPKCGKQLKVPAEFEGKRVKCKDCAEVFPVTAAGKPAAKAAPPAAKAAPQPPAAPVNRFADDDDDDDTPGKVPNPLGVIKEDDVPRCPHCANDLDPPDAVVCLTCGFNNQTRAKSELKKVYAPEPVDWIAHLGPGVIALVLAILLVALDIYCATNMRGWMEGGILELDDKDLTGRKKMIIPPGAFIMFIVAASAAVVVPAVKFAFRRLVLDYKPVEKVKK
jgi:hypothetical protein